MRVDSSTLSSARKLRSLCAALAIVAASLCSSRALCQEIVGWGQYGFSNIDDLSDVEKIAVGSGHVVALKGDGTVACWGNDSRGECRVPVNLGQVVAIAAGQEFSMALKADGTVACWGSNEYGQCNVPAGLTSVTAIGAGTWHCVALKSDGTVVCWGRNFSGECDVPPGLGQVVAIGVVGQRSTALKADGTFVCWGANGNSQCSPPSSLGAVTSLALGSDHTMALRANGTVVCWGDNTEGQCSVPGGLASVVAIAAGARHSVALKADGTVVCWGWNYFNQCDVPSGLSSVIAIDADTFSTAALQADGRVVRWGTSASEKDPPSMLGQLRSASGRLGHVAAVRPNGLVVCWGDNSLGQCDVPANLGEVLAVSAGGNHTVALRTNGTVACWGGNYSGQCDVPAGLGNVIAITAGSAHTVAVRSNGALACWGSNQYGQCAPPANAVNLREVAAGYEHNVAVRLDGVVVCWGANYGGQTNVPPGLANVVFVAAGQRCSGALRADGSVALWGDLERPAAPLERVVAIALGVGANSQQLGVALHADGTVTGFGFCPPEFTCTPPSDLAQVAAFGGFGVALRCPATEVVELQSAELGALGSGSPRQHTFASLVPPTGDATVTVRVRGDFDAANEFATLELDGQLWSVLFQAGASDCPASPDVAVVTVPAKQFAALAADGSLTVRLQASPDASATQCPNGSTVIELSYAASPSDCNGNGFDDGCEVQFALNDCNGNGRPDDCDIADGISVDADADGTPDECAADCNGNGTPDILEIASGALEDCDENGVADLCEKRTTVALDAQFSPIGYGFAARWEIKDAVPAVEPVTLSCRTRGDFGATLEYLRLMCGNLFAADAFVDNFDCPPFLTSAETFVLTPEQFNNGIGADGVWRLDAAPSIAVDAMLCDGGTLLELALSYVGASAADCNGNSLLDTCEIANGWAPDVNANGIPDGCETLFDACPTDLDGDGATSAIDLATLLSAWGAAKSPADVDGNGSVDALDLAAMLNAWGPCPQQ